MAVAMSSAVVQELAMHDLQLSVALGASAAADMLDKVSEATALSQKLMRQFNLSLARLCCANGEEREMEAAAGVCRVIFGRLPLIASFCNDAGVSGRQMWSTLLSAAASFRSSRARGEGGDAGGEVAAVSPYVERVYELLCERSEGGGRLYDIPAVHVELVAALVELLAQGVEAVLKSSGRDLLQACNHEEGSVEWGARALVALRRAVRKKDKTLSKSKRDKVSKDKIEAKDRKEKKSDQKAKKRKSDSDDSSSSSESSDDASAMKTEAAAAAPVKEETAVYDTCRTMWMSHPGACGAGEGGGGGGDREEKDTSKEKVRKEKEKENQGSGLSTFEAVRQLTALLQCVAEIPADLLTMPCKQVCDVCVSVYVHVYVFTCLYCVWRTCNHAYIYKTHIHT